MSALPGARAHVLPAALLALHAVAAGCGESREERAFEEIERQCLALVAEGATLEDAAVLFRSAAPQGPFCRSDFGPLPNDACGAASEENAICQRLWWWIPSDPALCGQFGCCLACEVRTRQTDAEPAPACASRFVREQPCPGSGFF